MDVFLVDSFAEFFVYLFEVSKGIDVGHFILLRVVVDFVIVEFVVIFDIGVDVRLTFYEKVGKNVFILNLFQIHCVFGAILLRFDQVRLL